MGGQLGEAIGNFCLIFFGSLFIGIASALVVAFLQKRQTFSRTDETERDKEPSEMDQSSTASAQSMSIRQQNYVD